MIRTLVINDELNGPDRRKIILRTQDKIYALNIHEVIRLESDGSYTTVYSTGGRRVMVSRQLKEFDELLSPAGFLRVHQSHLVSLEAFYCYDRHKQQLILQDGTVVPVSSRKRELVMSIFSSC